LCYADKVICVSRRQYELILEVRGRTIVIYNCLSLMPDIEKNFNESPTILYVGGGGYIKGFHIAAKILAVIQPITAAEPS